MKQYAREYVLGDITEADFQNWKHHPVTKIYRRYLRDYERFFAEHQIGVLRNTKTSPDQFVLGEFKGTINGIKHAAEIEYQTIFEFYPSDAEEEQD